MNYGLSRAVPMSILGFCLGVMATVLLRALQQIDPVWNPEIGIIFGMLLSAVFFVAYMGAFDPAMSAHGDEHHDDDHAEHESHAVMHDERAAALVATDVEAKPVATPPRPRAAAAAIPAEPPIFVPTYARTSFAAVVFGAILLLLTWLVLGDEILNAIKGMFPAATWLNVLPVIELDGLFTAILGGLWVLHLILFGVAVWLNTRYPLLRDAIAAIWDYLGGRAGALNTWLGSNVRRQWQPRAGVGVFLINLIATLIYFLIWSVGFLLLTIVITIALSAFGGVWLFANVLNFAGGGSGVIYQIAFILLVLLLGIWTFVQYSGFNLRITADPAGANEAIGFIPINLFGAELVFTELTLLLVFLIVTFVSLALIGGLLAFVFWLLSREVAAAKKEQPAPLPGWTKAPFRVMGGVATWLLDRLPEPPQPRKS